MATVKTAIFIQEPLVKEVDALTRLALILAGVNLLLEPREVKSNQTG